MKDQDQPNSSRENPVLRKRRNIPFYTEKSEAEFSADPYENYEGTVKRQIQLHLGGPALNAYAWQAVEDWFLTQLGHPGGPVLEIGCSVGNLIGTIADRFPETECHGLDFSYQLLKVAHDYWCAGKEIELADPRGFTPLYIGPRKTLDNLQFGLARAEKLPFPAAYLDTVLSSFLFDRLENPMQAAAEWWRVLRPGGKLLLITPLNFQRALHWQAFYPEAVFLENFKVAGWKIEQQTELTVYEPLDVRGNAVRWKCLAVEFSKPA